MPHKRKLFTSEQETEIARSYEEGLTIAKLADKFSVSRTAITNCLIRHEVKIRPRSSPRPQSEWNICDCGNKAIYTKGLCRTCYDRERNRIPEVQERRFNWKLKKSFGITREDYDRVLQEQDNVCAICKKPDPRGQRLAVDHDHACCPGWYKNCGKCTRGLLCVNCNSALGYLKEDIRSAENLIAYLKRYSSLDYRAVIDRVDDEVTIYVQPEACEGRRVITFRYIVGIDHYVYRPAA
jgi:hypothetical protein